MQNGATVEGQLTGVTRNALQWLPYVKESGQYHTVLAEDYLISLTSFYTSLTDSIITHFKGRNWLLEKFEPKEFFDPSESASSITSNNEATPHHDTTELLRDHLTKNCRKDLDSIVSSSADEVGKIAVKAALKSIVAACLTPEAAAILLPNDSAIAPMPVAQRGSFSWWLCCCSGADKSRRSSSVHAEDAIVVGTGAAKYTTDSGGAANG